METSIGLPRVITGGAVSVVKMSRSFSRILARTTYRLAATIFAGSYARVNRIGGLPGLATRVVAMIDAAASARETSSRATSNTASGGRAIRSRNVAVPYTD